MGLPPESLGHGHTLTYQEHGGCERLDKSIAPARLFTISSQVVNVLFTAGGGLTMRLARDAR